jgi:hypothetical protein
LKGEGSLLTILVPVDIEELRSSSCAIKRTNAE